LAHEVEKERGGKSRFTEKNECCNCSSVGVGHAKIVVMKKGLGVEQEEEGVLKQSKRNKNAEEREGEEKGAPYLPIQAMLNFRRGS